MKLITNNPDPMSTDGVIIRADVSADGTSTVYKVFHNGVLLDTIADDSVLTVAALPDADRDAKVAAIASTAYSNVN